MMDRKPYQIAALDTLTRFARRAAEIGPHRAFAQIASHEPAYRDQGFGGTPYLCLRLPTGGGKTVLAADAIPVLRQFAGQDYPLTLWLVPSKAILDQTAATLRDPQHPYRERLNAQFGIDRVRVLSLEDATGILPQEVHQKALIVVCTTQALRVDKMDTRKVYAGHEGLDATFERLTAAPDMDTDEQGRVLASFVNLCRAWPPLVIVDEAHNARTSLSFDTLKRFAPAFILELTATPAADPKSGSNVLVRVSARELRDATMIKLPVVVTEYGGDWTATIAGAVRERAMLEDLARQDGRGIRPIALYQAERKDGTVTPETIRAHLIENEDIAEDEIAIATGTQRGIDGVDLFLPGCKIRHIITVQALKEGWDCAWAYVLCSVANIRSPKDIEQLLGRVLRMPNAQASRFDPLNRAYAHVTHGAFQTTAKQLRDALVTLGFDRDQAQEAVQTPFHFDEDDDLLAVRRGTSVVLPGAPPNLDGLPGSDLAGIAITRQSAESTTLRIQPEAPPEAIDRLCERLPANQRQPVRDAYRQAVALRCPAERGETLTLPLLAWRQEELILGEATAEELRHHGRFSARDCPPHDCDWSNDRQATTSEIDADAAGHLRISEATINLLPQRALSEQLDRDWLVYWLARECRRTDTTEPDMIAYLTGWITHLEQTHGLDALRVHKYRLQGRLTQCLDQCALKAAERGLSNLFDFQDGADSPLTIAPEVFVGFRPETDYRPTKPLRGRVFRKHLYPVVGEMNRPETDVAAVLDSLPEVEVWLRNLDRHPRSFRLPCPSEHGDWFYPDFLGRLTDTRLLVTEYKGGYLEPFDSRKRQMGLAWQRAMNGRGVFLWIGDSAETSRGRSIAQQIQDGLRGGGARIGPRGYQS
ncbi:DEAD/DEAH box helicase family protein [uncultured Thiodictyon sp.]|jgi:type III restriction enzyme|uniref:DEAD/DEAH box helicase n=1 Tax=uncultured Thiodictyon sp. TaxID=1846217 RepID=UPI0025CC3DAE|nr:DEAD/DEAH box helicase family protein [uncultured Thiodictyon sp.]